MQIRKKKRIREGMVEHLTIGNHIANCIIHFCLIMVAVISLLPMWHVLMSSVSDGFSLLSYKGVAVVPVGKPTLEGYRLIFRDASVWIGYKNTIIYVAGTVGHLTIGNHIANCIINFCLIMVAVISLLPMWHVLMSSVSDGFSLLSYKGVAVVPVGKPTLEGYRLIFRDASVWIGYKNTIIYVAGTVGLGFVLNVLGGYALSQPTKGKGIMYGFLFVTMLFSGGIVPTYMVMNTLGLTGSRLSIILLEATQTFYLIFAAKAFAAVPLSTVEAARIDGAGHLRVMFQIMLPQAKGMFFITLLNTFVGAWNSWYNASIYVPADKTKWPIQLFINEMTSANVNFLETATPNYSRYLIQFAVIVVATLPIMVAMPFFQDKIEAGQLQGGVKG